MEPITHSANAERRASPHENLISPFDPFLFPPAIIYSCAMSKPLAKDLTHHLSEEAKSRSPSPLKGLLGYFFRPDLTYLAGGLPLSDYFPFDRVSCDTPSAPFPNGIGAQVTDEDKTTIDIFKNKAKNEPEMIELARSLQYGRTEGQPELVNYFKEHTRLVHNPPYQDWGLISTVGNTQSWDATLRTFVGRGDAILVEDYSFSSALETAIAQGVVTVPVPMDDGGVVPEALEKLLDNWVGPKPKLFYTICTGQNPTGTCINEERRRAIYELAQKHDFIIVEDEPYYFLQMDAYTTNATERRAKHVHDHEEFVKALIPSYLSIDVDGRVIRLDSLSKTIAPGVRYGWIIAQEKILERFIRLHEVSIQSPSGFTQTLLNGLFQKWGQSGYLDWLIGLRAEYTHKRDVTIDTMFEHFPKEVVHIIPPVAGMFFIVKVDASKHPKFKEFGEDPLKVETVIYEKGIEKGCVMVPGSWFKSKGITNPPQPEIEEDEEHKHTIFFRGTYAAVPLENLKDGLRKFGEAIKAEFGL